MNRHRPPGIWVTNHLANPLLRHLLRGPAGHRLSRRLALIRYRGRRTGRMYELLVQYARDGNRVWILPGSPEHKTWWRNLRGGADVDLVLAAHDIHGHAMVIDRSRQPEFAEGLTAYLRAVPQARRALGLPKQASPSPGDTEPRQISDSAVLVCVDLDD
jgi:F420H(2)-dependent quinone reductase